MIITDGAGFGVLKNEKNSMLDLLMEESVQVLGLGLVQLHAAKMA